MTSLLCKVCHCEIFENEAERKKHLATLRKKNDRSLYTKYTNINNNFNDFDKILNEYVSKHNREFNVYFLKLTCELKFGNNFVQTLETNYQSNFDLNYMKAYLLCFIDFFTSRGYKVSNINYITINTINDRCNMTYEYHIKQPMHAIDITLKMIVAKSLQLINYLERKKNHPFIRKYSHIPFNN